ncbi:DUF4236 domain-containing protein [Roseovarius nanhaiticus]|uniref:DUF4236 domain-containing protein n=1 Tax=Roseovarius nanhaiticus TaxID=573024 RepID=UPI0024923526|nr:DUF4236 domain-containing protein [Roseovarius nanhaiticus]
MPFYIRDSISIGPFRINISKSGLGVSAGVKGLWLGSGPRGHYIHVGANGVYYRKTLGVLGEKSKAASRSGKAQARQPAMQEQLSTFLTDDGVLMKRIMSSDAELLVSESHSDAIANLNEARARTSLALLFSMFSGIVLATAFVSGEPAAIGISLGLLAVAFIMGTLLDVSRKTVVLAYDLDPTTEAAYRVLTTALDDLGRSGWLQFVKAQGDINNLQAWKKNSGASSLVDTEKTEITYEDPKGVASNITPPSAQIDGSRCYFSPIAFWC